jgi:Uma2 family endonuclease
MINFVDKNKGDCQVFYAPFDVRLPKKPEETANKQIYTVVQPDICVVCDRSKLDRRGCLGAPDMIVEILSVSSQRYDLREKYDLYEASGVKEYWVVSPKEKGVQVFVLQEDGKYGKGVVYDEDSESVPVLTLKGLSLDIQTLFAD